MPDESDLTSDALESSLNVSSAAAMFPNAKSLFQIQLKTLEEITSDCYVFLDANVLLHPYNTSKDALAAIEKTYTTLTQVNRLFIPGQSAREFAKNRETKFSQLHKQLSDFKSRLIKVTDPDPPLIATLASPYLEALDKYQQVKQQHAALVEAAKVLCEANKVYNLSLKPVQEAFEDTIRYISKSSWNDQVTDMYSTLFTEDLIVETTESIELLRKDLILRQYHSIAPGYKDKSKDDNGIGDLLIWKAILEKCERENKHALFVTSEKKSDWWVKNGDNLLYPRFSLIEEFYRSTNGNTFHISSFSDFLELFGNDITIVEEVRSEESRINNSSTTLLMSIVENITRNLDGLGQAVTGDQIRKFLTDSGYNIFNETTQVSVIGPDRRFCFHQHATQITQIASYMTLEGIDMYDKIMGSIQGEFEWTDLMSTCPSGIWYSHIQAEHATRVQRRQNICIFNTSRYGYKVVLESHTMI